VGTRGDVVNAAADALIACVSGFAGWVIGVSMGLRVKPGKLDVPDDHPALGGPLGDIVRNGKVRR